MDSELVASLAGKRVLVSGGTRGMGAAAAALLAVPGRETTGAPGGRYANELFTIGRGDVLVYYPADEVRPRGRVARVTLPPVELATVMHHGPHDDIDVTYGSLGAWVVEHALAVAGPVHETYLVGPREPGIRRLAHRNRLAHLPPGIALNRSGADTADTCWRSRWQEWRPKPRGRTGAASGSRSVLPGQRAA